MGRIRFEWNEQGIEAAAKAALEAWLVKAQPEADRLFEELAGQPTDVVRPRVDEVFREGLNEDGCSSIAQHISEGRRPILRHEG